MKDPELADLERVAAGSGSQAQFARAQLLQRGMYDPESMTVAYPPAAVAPDVLWPEQGVLPEL